MPMLPRLQSLERRDVFQYFLVPFLLKLLGIKGLDIGVT
jgi:hypothetical protein